MPNARRIAPHDLPGRRMLPPPSASLRVRLFRTRPAWALGLLAAAPLGLSAEVPPATPSIANLVDELPIEQLGQIPVASVSTASRFTQKITDAPASVTVIEAEDFKRFGYRTLADALRSVRGLHVTGDRSYTYLGIRGFSQPSDYNSRVLVLVDGHRVNDNVFEGAYIGREFILDADNIERVEVVRGPTSSLYGSSAFFGVINVITKRPGESFSSTASAEAGSFESYKGFFRSSGPLGSSGIGLSVSGSFYDAAGQPSLYYPEFDTPDQNLGRVDRHDGERAWNLHTAATWRDLTLSAAYVLREKEIPTASWDTLFGDPRYRTTDSHGYVDLALRHEFTDDTELTARAYFDDVRYSADYPIRPSVPEIDSGLNIDDSLGRMVGFQSQVNHHWRRHRFTLGTEVRGHLNQEIANLDTLPEFEYAAVDESSYDVGAYAQDEWVLVDPLVLSAGVRYDHFESFGDTLNPRLGVIYHPWETTAFKLLYGTAFRAPNSYELYFPLGDLPPASGLDPERIQTYEAVWEQYFGAGFRFSLSGYLYHLDDLISVDPDSLLFANVGQVDATGVEGEVEWRHATGIQLRANYALQRAEYPDTHRRLSNSPEHLLKLGVLLPWFQDRLSTGFEVQHTSRGATLPDRLAPYADGYWIANLTVFHHKLVRGLEASASLYNLFDERFDVPGGPGHLQDLIEQDGRTWRVKLTYRF
jgi:iron complex outermembrane receptor protein